MTFPVYIFFKYLVIKKCLPLTNLNTGSVYDIVKKSVFGTPYYFYTLYKLSGKYDTQIKLYITDSSGLLR